MICSEDTQHMLHSRYGRDGGSGRGCGRIFGRGRNRGRSRGRGWGWWWS